MANYPLTLKQQTALSLGLNFIPIPNKPANLHLYISEQFEEYSRSIMLKAHYLDSNSNSDTTNSLRCVHSTQPRWTPPVKHTIIYKYLSEVKEKLTTACDRVCNNNHLRTNLRRKSLSPLWVHTTLKELRDNKEIIITDADKNMGVVVISTTDYINEGLRQLNDPTTYKPLPNSPNYKIIWNILRNILDNYDRLHYYDAWKKTKCNTKLSSYLLQLENHKELRLGNFYLLMKVHKNPILGRPIVSSINTITYYASKYVDSQLQPILHKLESFVESSEHLLYQMEQHNQFPSENYILCADIDSLYPNIPLNTGLQYFRKSIIYYNTKHDKSFFKKEEEINFLCELTNWILKNNYFTFGKKLFHQVNGTAMGTPVAVVFACLFIDELERNIFTITKTKPILYKRYIDDIFSIWNNKEDAQLFINTFNSTLPTIHCSTYTINSEEGIFLDLIIYRSLSFNITGKWSSRLYQKPQNKYLYLPPNSYHAKSIFPAYISAELKRYRILCSEDIYYNKSVTDFYQRLLARGYNSTYLDKLFNVTLDRLKLFEIIKNRYHDKSNKSSKNISLFKVVNFPETRALNITSLLQPSQDLLVHPLMDKLFRAKNPITCYINPPSSSTYFSRARKLLHNSQLPSTSAINQHTL